MLCGVVGNLGFSVDSDPDGVSSSMLATGCQVAACARRCCLDLDSFVVLRRIPLRCRRDSSTPRCRQKRMVGISVARTGFGMDNVNGATFAS